MRERIRALVGIIFVLAGSGCFLYPNFREWRTWREVDEMMERFQGNKLPSDTEAEKGERSRLEEIYEHGESVDKKEETKDGMNDADLYLAMKSYNENLLVSGQHIIDAWSYEQTPIDLSLWNGENQPVGCIEIPDMRVRLPLFLGASDRNLARGAAVMSETSMPIGGVSTNCVIAGHRGWRGSAYFLYIEDMEIGSEVYITNPWETLRYKVTGVEVVTPSDGDSIMIQEGKDMITLVSCHPYTLGNSPYRYLVFCERTGSADAESEAAMKDWYSDGQLERGVEASSGRMLRFESYIRTVLPILLLVIAVILVVGRYRRNRKRKKDLRL